MCKLLRGHTNLKVQDQCDSLRDGLVFHPTYSTLWCKILPKSSELYHDSSAEQYIHSSPHRHTNWSLEHMIFWQVAKISTDDRLECHNWVRLHQSGRGKEEGTGVSRRGSKLHCCVSVPAARTRNVRVGTQNHLWSPGPGHRSCPEDTADWR